VNPGGASRDTETCPVPNRSIHEAGVKRGAFSDGPGIRTTIFLKGCPLRCLWCCNPEGQAPFPEIKVVASRCTMCAKCLDVCPKGAITLEPSSTEKVRVDRHLCNNCGKCINVCPAGALDLFGRYVTVDEVLDILAKDAPFYRVSVGGATLGGGEPTFQPDFTLEVLRECRDCGIHTALDTCGYTRNKKAALCLEEADLLLYDIKGLDNQTHLKGTGVPNDIILKNLERMDQLGKPIIVRVPLIPRYTNSQENLQSVADFILTLRCVERVDILPYHRLGMIKYLQLGREYKLRDIQSLSEHETSQVIRLFKEKGIRVQAGG